MEEFQYKVKEMVHSCFNLNLFGNSGCGKTTLINKIFDGNLSQKFEIVKLNFTDFYSKKNIFKKIVSNLNKFLNNYKRRNLKDEDEQITIKDSIENINKWYDLFETLEFLKGINHKFYFIIDGILDLGSFNYFKKELIKLFVAVLSCPNMRLILVSNFDITNSEIQYDYDFSSFISIQYPELSEKCLKKIIDKECYSKSYNPKIFEEIIKTCVSNFQYNITNLNEILLNIQQNLQSFNSITSDSKLTEFLDKTRYEVRKHRKRKSKDKNKKIKSINEEDMDIETNTNTNKRKYEENKSEEEEEDKDNEDNCNIIRRDIYTHNYFMEESGINYSQTALRKNIKSQIAYLPIHIKKLDSIFSDFYSNITEFNSEEEKSERDNSENKIDEQQRNLNDSLSKSQKFLLLASFLANETSPKNDRNIFKIKVNRSNKKMRKKTKNNTGYNLRQNTGYYFNMHRLIAIYQSLISIHDTDKFTSIQNDDLMVKCEITTLSKLGLIRTIRNIDSKSLDQKYLTGINYDFASKIAEDYGIELSDFINYEIIE